jgi:hypothetical protein
VPRIPDVFFTILPVFLLFLSRYCHISMEFFFSGGFWFAQSVREDCYTAGSGGLFQHERSLKGDSRDNAFFFSFHKSHTVFFENLVFQMFYLYLAVTAVIGIGVIN